MAEKVIMPKAGMAMEFGTIIAWLKDVGDPVSMGEPLLEIETDKTSMQVESMSDGYLLNKLFEAGDQVPVVTTIGYIGQKGEAPPADIPQIAPPRPNDTTARPENISAVPNNLSNIAPEHQNIAEKHIPATPMARTRARQMGILLSDVLAAGVIRVRDVERHKNEVKPDIKATPLASRIAGMQGIDLQAVKGSGHGGKIFSADLLGPAVDTREQPTEAAHIPLNTMRKTIARRMLQSHQEIPPVTLHSEANVTRLWELRRELNDCEGVRISFNDLVIRAAAIALSEFPAANASFEGDAIRRHENVNIGVAVALEDGLIVPVIHNADRYTLRKLSEKARDLAVCARENRLKVEEYSGGTFTISNLGMFGITAFTPIINLPEACILGVCAIQDKVVLSENSAVLTRKYMGLSLTFDHRCLDGADGAKFLQRIVALLENPLELIL